MGITQAQVLTPEQAERYTSRLFKQMVEVLLPGFSVLKKRAGNPDCAPHDCLELLSAEYLGEFKCAACGALFIKAPQSEVIP